MKLAIVVESVAATRRAQCLQGQALLVVRTGEETLVAADRVGAVPGNRVLLATGAAAARYCMDAPVDAAVVAVVDGEAADGRS